MFRTLWNGWTTAARFQQVGACVLGCSSTAEDRIEHYAFCPHFIRLTSGWLGLHNRLANLEGFMLVADDMSDKEIALMAVAVYAMHRATAFYRQQPTPSREQAQDFLQSACQSAVSGHRSCLRFLEEATRLRHIGTNRCSRDRSRSPRRR